MVLLTRPPHTLDSPFTLILLSLFFLLYPSIVASSPLPYTPAEHATIDSLRARGVPEKEIEARLLPRHALAGPDPHAGILSSAEADPTRPFAAIESLVVKKIVGDQPDVIGEVLALSGSGDDEDDGREGSDVGDTKFRAVAKRGRRELGVWIGGLTGKVRRYMPELDRWVGRRDVEDGGLVVRGQMGKLKEGLAMRIGCWGSGSDSPNHISVSISSASAEDGKGDNVAIGVGLTLLLKGAFEKDEDAEEMRRAWRDGSVGGQGHIIQAGGRRWSSEPAQDRLVDFMDLVSKL